MAAFRSLLCFAALAVANVSGTPIARVISLLGKLDAQIQREGAKEAAEYDKFACYCKEQATETLSAIEKSTAKLSFLSSAIKQLDAEIKELGGDVADLKKAIAKRSLSVKKKTKKRGKDKKEYVVEADEVADAIASTKEAIAMLKGSKKNMKQAKLNLLQDRLLGFLSASDTAPTETQLRAVEALTQKPPKSLEKNHAYTYASNDIIAMLETLLDSFKNNKKETNLDEKGSISMFEKKKQSLQRESKFADKDKTEKETVLARKTEERADFQKDKDAETKAMKADQAFLAEITSQCENKAAQWDKRSKVRSDELNAMAQAMAQLKSGVKGNYALIQLHGGGSSAAVVGQAAALLKGDAGRLHSTMLMGLTLKLTLGGDPFKKVVGLVKDLIKKLQDEAKAAATTKQFCDKNMKKAVEKRDKNKLEVEDQEATIAMTKAASVKLGGEVGALSTEIGALKKSVLEATELRAEEKANNQASVVSAKTGKKAVGDAIQVLRSFYNAQLLQIDAKPGKLSAKNRHGKSVTKGPFEGSYKGKQEASKGVVGILEVIESDFQRTISNTKSEESSSASDFKASVKKTQSAISSKNTLKSEKEDAIKKATTTITQAKDDRMDAKKLMETALEELEKISAMCLTGEGTFAERKKQREQEIKSLQGAMQILESWKM